ncbi:hypothetical protein CEXT_154811 [Caerostris extrusa]|uniref:Uncharacterized protein n=1 Tax=Caerostris extrusa TaxID=172846 RepID=A0AAV4X7I9_CAEEX|nr:hypothetical protein CEXT_154811 [Caerostris extrusa]
MKTSRFPKWKEKEGGEQQKEASASFLARVQGSPTVDAMDNDTRSPSSGPRLINQRFNYPATKEDPSRKSGRGEGCADISRPLLDRILRPEEKKPIHFRAVNRSR